MTGHEKRPGGDSRAFTKALAGADDMVPDDRDRCTYCRHIITDPRSLARGAGPVCWARTELGQLNIERDAVGRALRSLARRVAHMDMAGLATVATGLSYAVGGAE